MLDCQGLKSLLRNPKDTNLSSLKNIIGTAKLVIWTKTRQLLLQ